MSRWLIAVRGLFFNKRINLAVALGVAAATAVLTGALIVGDSMRGSLRDLTLDRLGKIDILITSPGFFSENLQLYQRDKENQSEIVKVPIIYFPNGSAEASAGLRRASNVAVIGMRKNFWWLFPNSDFGRELASDEIILNATLAEDLGVTQVGDLVTIGIPEQQLLPADSALGEKQDLFERIVDLKVAEIIPAAGAGRFSLHPSQLPPRNAFVSIELLQSVLSADILKFKSNRQQANMLLVAAESQDALQTIQQEIRPQLEDLGLRLQHVRQPADENEVPIFDYYSLSSDRLVIDDQTASSIRSAFPESKELLVYMANDMQKVGSEQPGIPFSIVAAIDFNEEFQPVSQVTGQPANVLGDNEIAISEWMAEDQQLAVGDRVKLVYFEPETSHGQSVEASAEFVVADILKLTQPDTAFRVTRRGAVTPPVFSDPPTLINDPEMTPIVPGLTDAASIENWELPFDTADKIRSQDDEYWDFFRTTPKAFVSLSAGRKYWGSRFGETTSFRIPAETAADGTTPDQLARTLIERYKSDQHLAGLQLVPIKANGLKASSGATPFDVLFLMLSMFVIASALILVSLLFRLGIEQRSGEIGVLKSSGFSNSNITRVWLMESTGVAAIGAILGTLLGMGYAWLMLLGLKTWWVGAISTPFLSMHVSWWTIPAGVLLGVLVCVGTIYWTIRRTRSQPVRNLLSGRFTGPRPRLAKRRLLTVVSVVAILSAIATSIAAFRLAGETQAIAFLTVGFIILMVLLVAVWMVLSARSSSGQLATSSLARLAMSNGQRNPLRSTLTIGLVSVAAFLILAISAFRLAPTEEGTAGFDYVAQTSQPVFDNLNSETGRQAVLGNETLAPSTRILALRYKTGEDASCNNLYQSTQPRVLGVTDEFIDYFDQAELDFAWYSSLGKTEEARKNPWHVLKELTSDEVVPVVIDKNTAWYNLKIYLPGQTFTIDFDSGESVKFRLVGLLDNTLLQGSLLVYEEDFNQAFPDISGYRYFLVDSHSTEDIDTLSAAWSDQGFEARSADKMLAGFLAVQNTYLSTFQSLGALGLLLGTFGLVAVQLRSVFERRRELAVMRAIGFSHDRLANLVLRENLALLTAGLGIGCASAFVTTLPYLFIGRAYLPWRELIAVLVVIFLVGVITSYLASRAIQKAPLVQSLRV